MVTDELKDYIVKAKEKGFSNSDIKAALLGVGWKTEDIDQILLPQQTIPTKAIAAGGSIITVMIAGVFGYVLINKKEPITPQVKGDYTQILPTATITPTETPSTKAVYYTSRIEGITFKHLADWDVEVKNNMMVVSSPSTKKTLLYTQFGFGDVVISSVPYQNARSEKAAEDLANKLAGSNTAQKISNNGWIGYMAATSAGEGQNLNVVVKGTAKMIVIQFPYITEQQSLTEGQRMVLESLIELK